jgi:hypothetical protein
MAAIVGLAAAGCGGTGAIPGRTLDEPLPRVEDNHTLNPRHGSAIWTEQSENWVVAVTIGDNPGRRGHLRLRGPGGIQAEKPLARHGLTVVVLPRARGRYRGSRITRGGTQSITLTVK